MKAPITLSLSDDSTWPLRIDAGGSGPMTHAQLADAVLGNYLFLALGVFVVVLTVAWLIDRRAESGDEDRIDASRFGQRKFRTHDAEGQ